MLYAKRYQTRTDASLARFRNGNTVPVRLATSERRETEKDERTRSVGGFGVRRSTNLKWHLDRLAPLLHEQHLIERRAPIASTYKESWHRRSFHHVCAESSKRIESAAVGHHYGTVVVLLESRDEWLQEFVLSMSYSKRNRPSVPSELGKERVQRVRVTSPSSELALVDRNANRERPRPAARWPPWNATIDVSNSGENDKQVDVDLLEL
jgi:hypothetical protein